MWIKDYNPSERGWYIVKINGKALPMTFNIRNLFWCGMDGKTYQPNQIDCWLDHDKVNFK